MTRTGVKESFICSFTRLWWRMDHGWPSPRHGESWGVHDDSLPHPTVFPSLKELSNGVRQPQSLGPQQWSHMLLAFQDWLPEAGTCRKAVYRELRAIIQGSEGHGRPGQGWGGPSLAAHAWLFTLLHPLLFSAAKERRTSLFCLVFPTCYQLIGCGCISEELPQGKLSL